ncbi:MAG: tol-pal system protein YbgF [Desulfobulbaceae bacterium]|nr:tol-pal system protein YbgF [Desulfobulbaceae bacterium]
MKNSIWSIILLLFFSPFLIQCVAGTSQGSPVDLRFRNLETRMTTMERDTKSISAQNQGQASMGLTVDNLEAQMLQAKGHLEENNRQLRAMEKKNQDEHAAIDEQIDTKIQENNSTLKTQIEEQLADMQKNLAKVVDLLNTAMTEIDDLKQARTKDAANRAEAAARAARNARELAQLQAERATAAATEIPKATGLREIAPTQLKKKIAEAGTKSTATAAKKVAAKVAKSPAAKPAAEQKLTINQKTGIPQYDKALALYHSHKYKESYNTFLDYLDKEPKGEMVPNARFWLGDCLFKLREYELAILEYQKVIADFPKHDKAPAALLKQGQSFERLKDEETARIVYKKLIEDFPKSEQAETAKRWLDKH